MNTFLKSVLLSLATACAMLLLATPAQAQSKIGFVSLEKLMRESAPAKRATAKLEKEFAARTAEVQKLEKQIRDLEQELAKETVTMPEATKREKERQLERASRDFQRMSRELREDVNLRKNEELAQVMEKAQKAVNEIAEKDKFDIIFQEAVFASSRIDITEKVLKALADK